MHKTLALATAEINPAQRQDDEHRFHPRVDYLELSRLANIDIVDYDVYKTPPGKWLKGTETRLRSDLYLAFEGMLRSRDYQMVLAMSERVGIPFAGLHRFINRRKPFMMMFMCWSWRQELVITRLGLFKSADVIVVLCNSLRDHMIRLGADPSRVRVVPLGIDNVFYAPQPRIAKRPGFIMSVGESRTRDYVTLMQAVDGLPVELLMAASGSWYAREKDRIEYSGVPANVTVVRHLPPVELRNYYAQANFVVLPVVPSVASFGGTAALEAYSMGIPVIANRSPGLMDYVIDGETGILVEPGDKAALREAIEYLITNPDEARRMGRNARLAVERELNMDCYVQRLAALIDSVAMRESRR